MPCSARGVSDRVLLEALQIAVHAHHRLGAGREVQVGALHLQKRREQLRDRGSGRPLSCMVIGPSSHFTTLATSSIDVRPIRVLARPSSRSVIMPCWTAMAFIWSDDARSTVSRSISSVIGITSYSPSRPR